MGIHRAVASAAFACSSWPLSDVESEVENGQGGVEVVDMKILSKAFLGLSTCRLVTARLK